MKSKKPTDIKSVSVDQLRDLETKTVVGASTASAQGGKTASKKAKDSAKLDNTLDKTIDDNDNDNRREDAKRAKDQRADQNDIQKMNEDDLKDALSR